jgi:hypothetical protein
MRCAWNVVFVTPGLSERLLAAVLEMRYNAGVVAESLAGDLGSLCAPAAVWRAICPKGEALPTEDRTCLRYAVGAA